MSSCAADSPPPMYCNDEATIWMSSSAMKPPKHITTNGNRLLSQPAVSDNWGHSPAGAPGFVSTLIVVERPGRSSPSLASSSPMRTGTRCTILVKLPVAFSGGITLNTAPVPGARLRTWPWKTLCGRTSATTVPGCQIPVQLSRSGLSSKVKRDLGFGPHDPQARCFCDMLSPALRPEHALLLTLAAYQRADPL